MMDRVPAKTEIADSYSLPLEGYEVKYRVRVSNRAKRVRLEINAGKELLVVVPKKLHLGDIPRILETKSRWILDKLNSRKARLEAEPWASLRNKGDVLYRGNFLTLHVLTALIPKPDVRLDGNSIRIATKDGSHSALKNILQEWYHDEARRLIVGQTETLAREYEISYSKVYIRNQRTRWGSCSSRRNLSFNWRLILMPAAVMRYVILHELTHLDELNHSSRFWHLLEERCEEYRLHRDWLRMNGIALMAQ